LLDGFNEVCNNIYNRIKLTELKNIWDDYDLINVKGLNVNEIRELTPENRQYQLKTIGR
jgi:hypothetical protein